MSETKFTPGPYAVCERPPNVYWHTGRTIYSVPLNCRVADVAVTTADERALADAHLFASSWELYEALEREVNNCSLCGGYGEDPNPLNDPGPCPACYDARAYMTKWFPCERCSGTGRIKEEEENADVSHCVS